MSETGNGSEIRVESRHLTVEHISVHSVIPYAIARRRLESRLGRLHDGIRKLLAENQIDQVRRELQDAAGSDGLAIHYIGLHGDWLALEGGRSNCTNYLIGNVLYAVQMTKVDLASGLYAPLRVVLYEDAEGGSTFEYDRPSTLFGQFGKAGIDDIARVLDEKLLTLLRGVLDPSVQ